MQTPTPKGEDGLFASAVWDAEAEEYIIKVINTSDKTLPVKIQLEGVKKVAAKARMITLNCSDYDLDNSVDNPNAVVPCESEVATSGNGIEAKVPAKHFVLYRVSK
jgi:alpha-L-arabinofuranosidase